MLTELDRLRLGMIDIQRTLQEMRTDQAQRAGTAAALAGDAGVSISRFDFDGAKAVLASLSRIENTMGGMAGDMRELVNPAEARVLIAAERRRAAQQLQLFMDAGGEKRCVTVFRELKPILAASEQAELEGRYAAARRLLMSATSQAAVGAAALRSADMLQAGLARQRVNDEDDYARAKAEAERRLEDMSRQVEDRRRWLRDASERHRKQVGEQEGRLAQEQQTHERERADAQELVARASSQLRQSQALPQATLDQRQRRETLVAQAREEMAAAQTRLDEANARLTQMRAAHDEQRKADWWPTLPGGQAEQQIDQAARAAQQATTAYDHLAAAIANGGTLASENPSEAAQRLRTADAEASDLANGRKPVPRRRSTTRIPTVVPPSVCD